MSLEDEIRSGESRGAVHLDLEIGPAIAIDVALDSHERTVIDEMQLASVAVKVPRAMSQDRCNW